MEGIEEAVEGLFWKKRRMEYFFSKNMYDIEAGAKLFVQRWRIRAR
jgi:hypothetical protein